MELSRILKYTERPALYDKGTANMWTDPYIAEQLLQIHLNPDIDLASRKMHSIEQTVSWILSHLNEQSMSILDLGCGPGLYTEKLAMAGHRVTGVDFSAVSVNHARMQAQRKGLDIQYHEQNYLNLNLNGQKYDLVLMIYTDLGVLNPEDRKTLFSNIKTVLKPGGILIFDVLNDKDLTAKVSPKTWEAGEGGFWRPGPYIALSESILYEEEKVILSQHTIVEDDNTEVYRFWTHYFNQKDLSGLLSEQGFRSYSFHDDILPGNGLWSGNNVTFCTVHN